MITNRKTKKHTWEACTPVKTATPTKRKKSANKNAKAPIWWVPAWFNQAPKEDGAAGSVKTPDISKGIYLADYKLKKGTNISWWTNIFWGTGKSLTCKSNSTSQYHCQYFENKKGEKVPLVFLEKNVESNSSEDKNKSKWANIKVKDILKYQRNCESRHISYYNHHPMR